VGIDLIIESIDNYCQYD